MAAASLFSTALRHTPPRGADFTRQDGKAAEGIDQCALRLRGEQRLVRVLAVQVDQQLADLGQLGERRRAAVDPGAALSLRVERAPDEELVIPARVVAGKLLHGEPSGHVGPVADVERRRQLGALRARPQLPLLEAIAEQQRERVEQDRLAGARFAGEDREAAIELEVEGFDDDEIPDR